MYICICNAVTDREIRQAAALGAQSLEDLQSCLGVAINCGRCAHMADRVLREEAVSSPLQVTVPFCSVPA